MLKQLVMVAVGIVFSLNILADENCSTISNGVNYSVEKQAKYYCFDSKVVSVQNAYHDASIKLEDSKLFVSTSGAGTLFNLLIELDSGKQINATFVTVKSPIIKRVISIDGESHNVEIAKINK